VALEEKVISEMSLTAKKDIIEVIKEFKFIMIDYNALIDQLTSNNCES